ncbi:hypothetical protein SARC_00035 [Sphaeroforma arctica JP610]|uniref:Uncharacterized protein n=1 Tax=Sphaeroforma arctica JP610 TaxID=667725 RepID=A0A0L0GHS8_9EUKA|nr:hypothetical protein SARC_00035 [Sphaeroforma arctica JP610]KNC87903.1 hypothetical protein SARC_00035 [Sphaeroforma arctica JP610]|eukprot:XP_014161805.1 hypothetical protein SARC_00035 [Sphaeroforma arctica JP610]
MFSSVYFTVCMSLWLHISSSSTDAAPAAWTIRPLSKSRHWMTDHTELVRRVFLNDVRSTLQERSEVISGVQDTNTWEDRQMLVRQQLLEVLGPLPTEKTPLNVQMKGRLSWDDGNIVVEKVCECTYEREDELG